MENLDFSIVLPAYNESENLPDVARGIKSALNKAEIRFEIIVVDNGSIDNTGKVLKLLKKEIIELRTLRIEKNIGFGNGIIKGLEIARGSVLGYMVADGQVSPKDLAKVYLKLKLDEIDFCKGFRVDRWEGLGREILSKIYNFLFRLLFSCSFKDINATPKIFTRNFYETIKPQSKDAFIDPEILIKAKENNFSVGEEPVAYLDRQKGKSSVSILISFEFLKNMFSYFLNKKLK
jgi:glycosyltransferase involved in cell wall biosynthesis